MYKLRIFNGTCSAITLVADGVEDVVIGAKEYGNMEVDANARFGTDAFYVQEEGAWYCKTEQCGSLADLEVYREDNDLQQEGLEVQEEYNS